MKIRTRFATFLFLSLVLFLMGNLFLLSFFGQKYFAIYQIELSQSLTQANFRALSQAVSISSDASSGMTLQEYWSLLNDLAKVDVVLQKVEWKLSDEYPKNSIDPKEQLAQFFTSMRSDHLMETLFLSDSPEAHFVQRLLRDILLANLLFLSVVIVATFFLLKSALGPLKTASERASVIARTQDYVPIEYSHQDEIAPLISSFNRILAELALQNNSRNQVVRDMAHEIATPLMAMKSLMEALSDGIFVYSSQVWEQISRQISKIEHLSRRILSLESAGHKELHRQAIELHSFMQDFFVQYDPLFAKFNQSYEIHVSKGEIVAIDPMDLERILHNIATNFSKYAGKWSMLTLSLKKQSRYWLLVASDDGVGVSAEHMHKLGTLFYRADIARHTHHDSMSSWLGIALIEKVVSRYQWYARFYSGGTGKGFCITLYFPR